MTSVAGQARETLRLKSAHLEAIITHAQAGAPREVCGALAGRDGRVERVYATANIEETPTRYRMEPQEQLRIFLEIEEKGWELLGIYHSHPAGAAYPSATDRELAYYPDSVYVIISLRGEPEVRAFRILEGEVTPVGLVIES